MENITKGLKCTLKLTQSLSLPEGLGAVQEYIAPKQHQLIFFSIICTLGAVYMIKWVGHSMHVCIISKY